eukprot:350929-Chlamydomonas_euryale.AAC.5
MRKQLCKHRLGQARRRDARTRGDVKARRHGPGAVQRDEACTRYAAVHSGLLVLVQEVFDHLNARVWGVESVDRGKRGGRGEEPLEWSRLVVTETSGEEVSGEGRQGVGYSAVSSVGRGGEWRGEG